MSSFVSKADIIDELKELLVLNLELTETENVGELMKTVYSQSPIYPHQKLVLEKIFSNYDLSYELLNFDFVGEDGEYAYARIKFLAEKVRGEQFHDNELDALAIFKNENDQWQFWNQSKLEVNFR